MTREPPIPPGDEIADEIVKRSIESGAPKLATERDILSLFGEAIRRAGIVGEQIIAKLVFLAIVSRLLARPVSIVIKGGSSSGKSVTTLRTVKFFPSQATLAFTGMSEKALVLSNRSFANRTIVVYEATALRERAEKQSGDQTAYYIRSLVSEGETAYEMTVKTKGGFTTKRFEKKGPCNVIVTTTAMNLHNENETRMLSIHTDDSHNQTKAVLSRLADEVSGNGLSGEIDYEPWHELQDWLFVQPAEVVIPFAREIAKEIPTVAVRLRRDFGSVLALVQAHALLHQATRDRDERDRIMATPADYMAVRALVIDIVSQGVGATISQTTRDAVEAVAELAALSPDGVPAAAVGRHLDLDASAARRRLLAAAAGGFLVNQEDRRYRPGRYVVGQPIPDDEPILPEFPRHIPSDSSANLPSEAEDVPSRHLDPEETAGQPGDGMLAKDSEGAGECVRCDRYGPNHPDEHLAAWKGSA